MHTKYLTLDNFGVLQLSIQSLTCQYDRLVSFTNLMHNSFIL